MYIGRYSFTGGCRCCESAGRTRIVEHFIWVSSHMHLISVRDSILLQALELGEQSRCWPIMCTASSCYYPVHDKSSVFWFLFLKLNDNGFTGLVVVVRLLSCILEFRNRDLGHVLQDYVAILTWCRKVSWTKLTSLAYLLSTGPNLGQYKCSFYDMDFRSSFNKEEDKWKRFATLTKNTSYNISLIPMV
jgi:hypothetical protein